MSVNRLLLLPFVTAVMLAGAAFAQESQRGMFGASDLKAVVLSPAPLGPPAAFQPPATGMARPTTPRGVASSKPRQKTTEVARKPKSNPLDSYARDIRRQAWPCVGGGICAWTR